MKKQILSLLPASHPWCERIQWFDSIDSTNTEAKRQAQAGAPHGTVILADFQTGGRGRMGRSFHSPVGKGLYLSVILRPQCNASELLHLTCAAAVAACKAVSRVSDVRPKIKWTNDLVVGNRKLGGILTEMSVNADGDVIFAIIGIGINCLHQAEDFPPDLQQMATSLMLAGKKPPQIEALAASLIETLEKICDSSLMDKHTMMDSYRSLCITPGQQICLLRGDDTLYGTALDIDDNGGLTVLFEDGHQETVQSGEVSIRGMYGYV